MAADSASYRASVAEAEAILAGAHAGDRAAAMQALRALEAGAGRTQPEILDDLGARPPRTADALARLRALDGALSAPAHVSDPTQARRALKGILSLPRFRGLAQGPSLWDRLASWAVGILALLFSPGGLGRAVGKLVLIACGILLLAVLAWLVTAARGRMRSGGVRAGPSGSAAAPPEHFALAEELAAAGRYAAAVRALGVGVAARISADPGWEAGELTVREVFSRSGHPDRLDPLLVPFEDAVYGHRELGEAVYRAARAAADPYRAPSPAEQR